MPHHDDYDPESELGGEPATVIHNHYSQSKSGNGNGVNKLVWGCAAVLALMILGIQAFVGGKVWEMSDRLARVEATLEARLNQSGQ